MGVRRHFCKGTATAIFVGQRRHFLIYGAASQLPHLWGNVATASFVGQRRNCLISGKTSQLPNVCTYISMVWLPISVLFFVVPFVL